MSRPIGLTYTRGLEVAETTETGAPVRIASQFPDYPGVLVPIGTRVQGPLGRLDPAEFGVLIWARLPYASGAIPASYPNFFHAGLYAAGERIAVYLAPTGEWGAEVREAAVSQNIGTAADSFAANAARLIYVGGDATTFEIRVGDLTGSAVRTGFPDLSAYSAVDYGNAQGAQESEAVIAAVATFNRRLTLSEYRHFERLTRPPCHGEAGTGSAMLTLFVGADTLARSLPANGAAYDLNGGDVVLRALAGAGPGPSVHRMITTPFRDGAIYLETMGAVRKIVANVGIVSEDTPSAVWDLRRALASAANPRRGLGALHFAPADHVYEITALLDAEGVPLEDLRGPHLQNAIIPWACPGADWYDLVREDFEADVPLAGLTIPLTVPVTFSPALGEAAVDNTGDLPVYPVITITAGSTGATAPAIENTTTGQRFAMADAFAMAAGQVLVLDMGARTALLDGANAMGSRDPDTSMWALDPGVNNIEATTLAGEAEVRIRFARRYSGV